MIVAAVSGPVLGASPSGRTQVMTPVLCGIDLMEVARLEREVARRGDGLLEELFSPSELAWCRRRRRAAEGYAMAYAAKEALFKALGTGKVGRMAWSDIEIAWPEGACAAHDDARGRDGGGGGGQGRVRGPRLRPPCTQDARGGVGGGGWIGTRDSGLGIRQSRRSECSQFHS